ncbi:MAG: hypothetical protein ACSW8E_00200 [Clostridia bacterium]
MKSTKGRRSMGRSVLPHRLEQLAKADTGAFLTLLDELPDERLRLLLLLRHGFGLSWPAICLAAERRGLYYCERHLYRLYAQALVAAGTLLEASHEA